MNTELAKVVEGTPEEPKPAKRPLLFSYLRSAPSTEEYDVLRKLKVNAELKEFLSINNIFKTTFVGQEGRYACTSSNKQGYINNPLSVDLESISSLSMAFAMCAEAEGKFLCGWHIVETTYGYHIIQFKEYDEGGYENYSPMIWYNPKTGRVIWNANISSGKYDDMVKSIETYLPRVLQSLMKISLPIDLLEVCFASCGYSEEGYAAKSSDLSTHLLSGEIGRPQNTTHTLTGLSVISSSNGFNRHNRLRGKFALLIAQ
jgi:hypothetical protein